MGLQLVAVGLTVAGCAYLNTAPAEVDEETAHELVQAALGVAVGDCMSGINIDRPKPDEVAIDKALPAGVGWVGATFVGRINDLLAEKRAAPIAATKGSAWILTTADGRRAAERYLRLDLPSRRTAWTLVETAASC